MPAATRDELDATLEPCWYRRITPCFAAGLEHSVSPVRQQHLVMPYAYFGSKTTKRAERQRSRSLPT